MKTFRVKITMTGHMEIAEDSDTKNMDEAIEACNELYSLKDIKPPFRKIHMGSIEVDDKTLNFKGAPND